MIERGIGFGWFFFLALGFNGNRCAISTPQHPKFSHENRHDANEQHRQERNHDPTENEPAFRLRSTVNIRVGWILIHSKWESLFESIDPAPVVAASKNRSSVGGIAHQTPALQNGRIVYSINNSACETEQILALHLVMNKNASINTENLRLIIRIELVYAF